LYPSFLAKKQRNYGLHKSLGDNLNKITSTALSTTSTMPATSLATGVNNTTTTSTGSHKHRSHRSNSSHPNTRSSKSTTNLNYCLDDRNNDPNNNDDDDRIYVNTSQGLSTTDDKDNTSNDMLLSNFVMTKRKGLFMPFKSCSPPRRRSQVADHQYANKSLVERTINNFNKFDKNKSPDLVTFIQSKVYWPNFKPQTNKNRQIKEKEI
jgi:hypothetical protein